VLVEGEAINKLERIKTASEQAFDIGEQYGRSEIVKKLAELTGISPGWIDPSDFCYNNTNSVVFYSYYPHLFERLNVGAYRYIGINYLYSGSVTYRNSMGEVIVLGMWNNGVYSEAIDENQNIIPEETDHEDEVAVFREPVLLINTDQSRDLELYDQTRYCWEKQYFGVDITQFNTVCSTHKGKIYETYHVDSWHTLKEGDIHLHGYQRGERPAIITKDYKSKAIGRVYFEGKEDTERGCLYNGKIYKRPPGPVGPIPISTKLSDGRYVTLYKPNGVLSIWDGCHDYPIHDVDLDESLEINNSCGSATSIDVVSHEKRDLSNTVGRIQWHDDEVVLLVDFANYLYINEISNVDRNVFIQAFSNQLRNRAKKLGMTIDDKFRNFNGINMQVGNVTYILSNGKTGLSGFSNAEKKMVDLFKLKNDVYAGKLSFAKVLWGDFHEFIGNDVIQNDSSSIEVSDSVSDTSSLKGCAPNHNKEQIGHYVRRKLNELSQNEHAFSDDELRCMQDRDWSSNTFGLTNSFIKIVDLTKTLYEQQIDERGYNRYWKDTFTFGADQFLVSSQWYDRNRERFNNWLLNIGCSIEDEIFEPATERHAKYDSGEDRSTLNEIEYFPHKCIIIKIKDEHILKVGSVYEVVRHSWRAKIERAEQAEYVLASVRGKVVGVFIPTLWYVATEENARKYNSPIHPDRIAFIGEDAEEETKELYLNKRIPQPHYGSQNPINYTYDSFGGDKEGQDRNTTKLRTKSSINKYTPLMNYLMENNEEEVEFTFDEMETMLEFKLPNSAHIHPAWWSNSNTHPQGKAWLAAGFIVDGIDLKAKRVRFLKGTIKERARQAETEKTSFVDDAERENIIKTLLNNFSKSGIRLNSHIDFERFKANYNFDFPYSETQFNNLLINECAICDDIAYVFSESEINELGSIIEMEQSQLIYFETFFNKYEGELFDLRIYTVKMFKAIIQKFFPTFECRYGYFTTDVSVKPLDLVRECFKEKQILTFQEIVLKCPGLQPHRIKNHLSVNKEFISVSNNTYTHIGSLYFSEDEGERVAGYVRERLCEDVFVLFRDIDISIFTEEYSHLPYVAVRNAVWLKFLSDFSEQRGEIVSRKDEPLRVPDIISLLCENKQELNPFEIDDFCNMFQGGVLREEITNYIDDNMVRVSRDYFVNDSAVNFDIEGIDKTIALYCPTNFMSLFEIKDFSIFPRLEHPWNSFLLKSFVKRFSKSYKLITPYLGSELGAIAKSEFQFDDYDELMAAAVNQAHILLNANDVLDFLYEKGYIGRRKETIANRVIEKAQELLRSI
jgi:hypothetical protein